MLRNNSPLSKFDVNHLPQVLRNAWKILNQQFLKFRAVATDILPINSLELSWFYIQETDCPMYADDGNTSVPGTKMLAVWQIPFARFSFQGGEFIDYYHGKGHNSFWLSYEWAWRNSDFSSRPDNYPSLYVGRWGELKQERVWYNPCGSFNFNVEVVTAAIRIAQEGIERFKLEKLVRQTMGQERL